MTLAKLIFAKQIVSLVRRAWNKAFMLTPDEQGILKNAMGYFYAIAVDRYDQTPHVFMTMCNHIHVIQTDDGGKRGLFMGFFHSQVATFINRMYGRDGNVWDPKDKPGDQWLADYDAIEEKILYTLMNPVRAGIISKVEDWNHFKITPDDWGKTLTFTKPEGLEGPNWPDTATLNPVAPPEFDHLDDPTKHFNELVKASTEVVHSDMKQSGARFKTMKDSYNLKITDTPDSLKNKGKVIVYKRLPKIAKRHRSKNNPTYLASTADLEANIRKGRREFHEQYREAWAAYKNDKSTTFPPGTYQLVVAHGVEVDEIEPCSVFARFREEPD